MAETGEPRLDQRLRLVLLCAHPSLAPDSAAALSLRLVLGVSTEDIARLFLVQPADDGGALDPGAEEGGAAGVPFTLPAPSPCSPSGSRWWPAPGLSRVHRGLCADLGLRARSGSTWPRMRSAWCACCTRCSPAGRCSTPCWRWCCCSTPVATPAWLPTEVWCCSPTRTAPGGGTTRSPRHWRFSLPGWAAPTLVRRTTWRRSSPPSTRSPARPPRPPGPGSPASTQTWRPRPGHRWSGSTGRWLSPRPTARRRAGAPRWSRPPGQPPSARRACRAARAGRPSRRGAGCARRGAGAVWQRRGTAVPAGAPVSLRRTDVGTQPPLRAQPRRRRRAAAAARSRAPSRGTSWW